MRLFLTTLLAAMLSAAGIANAGLLNCNILVDGTSVATCTQTATGTLTFSSTTASPLFSSIDLTANGPPVLPSADLSTVTLDVSASTGFTGTHVLGVQIFQTGVSAPAGTTIETTATINNLIGLPGPTTLADYINGTSSTLGTTLRTSTFPVSFTGNVGPFIDTLTSPLTADAQSYAITFTGADQSANDTIQMQSVVQTREPASLAILGAALVGFFVWRRRQRRWSTQPA